MKKFALEEKLLELFHLLSVKREEKLVAPGLGWDDILELAGQRYERQMQKGAVTWPPACHTKDAETNMHPSSPLRMLTYTNTDSTSLVYFECGMPAHVKRNCSDRRPGLAPARATLSLDKTTVGKKTPRKLNHPPRDLSRSRIIVFNH